MTRPIGVRTTDWNEWSLPEMWAMLDGEDAAGPYEHILAWQRQHDLLVDQVQRLRTYRDELAVKWPPERSEAAAMFFARVDDMIDSMERAAEDSVTIRVRLEQIVDALQVARSKVGELMQRYGDAAEAEAAWAKLNPVERWVNPTGAGSDGWREEYRELMTEHARVVMRVTDDAVRVAAASMPQFAPSLILWQSSTAQDHPDLAVIETRVPQATIAPSAQSIIAPRMVDVFPVLAGGPAVPVFDATQAGAQFGVGLNGSDRVGNAATTSVGAVASLKPVARVDHSTFGGDAAKAVTGRSVPQASGVSAGVVSSTSAATRSTVPALPALMTGRMSAAGSQDHQRRVTVEGVSPTMGRVGDWHSSRAGGVSHRQSSDPSMDEYVARRSHQPQVASGVPCRESVNPIISNSMPEVEHSPGKGVLGIDR